VFDIGEKMPVMLVAEWRPFCHSFELIFCGAELPYAHYAVMVNGDEGPVWDRFYIKAVRTLAAFPDSKMVSGRD